METRSAHIINSKIATISLEDTLSIIERWIEKKELRYICVCNTHSLVEAVRNKQHNHALEKSDLNIPDGMPLVWILRKMGFKKQERVDGPNLMDCLCQRSNLKGHRIFLYGGTNENLLRLKEKLTNRYPNIKIVGMYSPPFRELNEEEKTEIFRKINKEKPSLVFISLGCPKQEIFMSKFSKEIVGVKIGVGAAFEYHSGQLRRPPKFIQKVGLEWLVRLMMEPKRLAKRYLINNTLFIYFSIRSYKRNISKLQNIKGDK